MNLNIIANKLVDKMTPEEYARYTWNRKSQLIHQMLNGDITEKDYRNEMEHLYLHFKYVSQNDYIRFLHEFDKESSKYAIKELFNLWFKLYNSQLLYCEELCWKFYGKDKKLFKKISDACTKIEGKRKELLEDPIWEDFGGAPDLMDYSIF